MTLQEILSISIEGKTVCILGIAGAGKSWLTDQLYDKKHIVVRTDGYMNYTYEEGMYVLLSDIQGKYSIAALLIDGVLNYRLIRKGSQTGEFRPDIIIMCEISTKKQHEIYMHERDAKKWKYMQAFNVSLMTVWNDYLKITPKEYLPEIYYFQNNW